MVKEFHGSIACNNPWLESSEASRSGSEALEMLMIKACLMLGHLQWSSRKRFVHSIGLENEIITEFDFGSLENFGEKWQSDIGSSSLPLVWDSLLYNRQGFGNDLAKNWREIWSFPNLAFFENLKNGSDENRVIQGKWLAAPHLWTVQNLFESFWAFGNAWKLKFKFMNLAK